MPGEAPAILPPLAFTRQLRQIVLLEEYSPSPWHVQIIAEAFDPSLATDGEPETPNAGRSRESPLLYYAPTLEAEADLLAEILPDRLLRNERVGILVPEETRMLQYVWALQDRGFLVQTRGLAAAYATAEKGARGVHVLTLGGPWNNSFDTLIVTRMSQGCFGSKDALWIGRYLARLVSCARIWCALGLDAQTPLQAVEGALRPLVEERKMAQLKLAP